ncbi:response regulator, partial [bacterium]|nr:response regulator [bacterium]
MQGKILLVDDEIINRKLLTVLLRAEDFTYTHAGDGEQALEIVAAEQIDLIILDIMMPRMDGFQFMAEYSRLYDEPRIPIIVSSALSDLKCVERALSLGAADYFLKPLEDEVKRFQLPLKVKNLIKMKRLQQEAVEKQKIQAV